MAPVKLLIVGAGSRGTIYSEYAKQHPDLAQVVGVAEPRDFFRQRMADAFSIPSERVFRDWTEAAEKVRFADAVILATGDREHVGPAVAFAERGYAMLLEKPMSPDEGDCEKIVGAAAKAGILFGVCHVLRYTLHTRMVKEIVESGAIGDVITMQHLEPVGYWHQAHSFVRGNWRNQRESSFMLMAKSCHDLDWMLYMMGRRCERVSSFGSLGHFRKDQQPAGAAERCLDCAVEANCPYSAKKIYWNRVKAGHTGWPVDVITEDLTEKGVLDELRKGPYGRCAYCCDNDVVDHQVVNLEFEGGRTAGFTMTAFTEQDLHRSTRIFGTRGELRTDGNTIKVFDFLTDQKKTVDLDSAGGSILGGHGGGDYELMKAFVRAVKENDPRWILSGAEQTLQSHRMVFAAERARVTGQVVSL